MLVTRRYGLIVPTMLGALAVAALGVFAFHGVAFAQQTVGGGAAAVAAASNLPTTSLPIIVARIIRAFIGVLGIIATVIIIYAGFQYMTSGGDQDKIKRAKRTLISAAIGLAIILASFAIATFVINAILRATGAGGGITGRDADNFIEPLSGSLGAGIVSNHYPPRNALAIPRNVKIFVTFKEAIDPGSFPAGVKIAPTDSANGPALAASDFTVTHDDAGLTFVFDPTPLLGSPTADTNYTVTLLPTIKKADGRNAFSGNASQGYAWTFTVSTAVDLTPPQVTSILPLAGNQAPNTTIQINFNEAMDPVASTGTFDPATPGKAFTNIQVSAGANPVPGTYTIGNGYRTVEFTPLNACGKDRCGETVFCLPFGASVTATAKAATVDAASPPQAKLFGASYDGLTDAAGNSLDGTGDGKADGPPTDSVTGPAFTTGSAVDDRTPTITAISPDIDEGNVALDRDVAITFSMPMKVTTLDSRAVQLWPEPFYSLWFVPESENLHAGQVAASGETIDATRALITHPTLLPPDVAGGPYFYYPLVTKDAKGINQFCMYPPVGPVKPGTGTFDRELFPYTCDGVPSASACTTVSNPPIELPDTSN